MTQPYLTTRVKTFFVFFVSCPTPLGSKVYLEQRGSIAWALPGAVLR